MEQPRVRICDIAEELGVSTATVSNVIHGKTQKLSEETVQRVTALLEEREYLPGRAEILLAQNPSGILGVFVNDHEKYEGHTLDDFFIAACLNSLSTEIEAQGLFMMVKKAKTAREILRFSSMWNMEGIVVIGFCEQDYRYLRSHMRIPFVVYDGFCQDPERIVNITIDNYDGGYQVGRWFRERGHRRALCISDNEICMDLERYRGFRDGFGGDGAGLLQIPMQREERWAFYHEELHRFRENTAVFAVSDYYAVDLMAFLREQGISVPGQVSVAGFDDTPVCRMVWPQLTSVRQDPSLRARLALEQLRALKEKQTVPAEIRLPVTLVVRGSTQ